MPAGQTYEKIATNTLSSNTQTVDFTSIPQTYTDLVIVVEGRATSSADFVMRVGNGSVDSGTNYSRVAGFGYSSGVSVATLGDLSGFIFSIYAARSMAIINLMNYTNTNVNKTALIRNNNGIEIVYASGNLWRSTVAIDTLRFTTGTHSFSAGTVFSIYGIKKA
jgi:hypothetical protein